MSLDLAALTEKVVSIIQKAVDVRVKAGWITPNDTLPLVTVIASGHIIDPVIPYAICEVGFQIDVWHKSMREADRIATRIIEAFKAAMLSERWCGLKYRIRDVVEEEAVRKLIDLSFKVIA